MQLLYSKFLAGRPGAFQEGRQGKEGRGGDTKVVDGANMHKLSLAPET